MEAHDLVETSSGGGDRHPCASVGGRVPFERLEWVVPELPFGLGAQPFKVVTLCIDVGNVIGALGQTAEPMCNTSPPGAPVTSHGWNLIQELEFEIPNLEAPGLDRPASY